MNNLDFDTEFSSEHIIDEVCTFECKPIKFKFAKNTVVLPDPIREIQYKQLLAADIEAYKSKNKKPKKSGKISSADITDDIPSNIKQYTLPDGSVVCVNTDETELFEESVIDSITKPK